MIITADRVVTGTTVLDQASVRFDGDRIVAVEQGRSVGAIAAPPGAIVVPGFVDIHVHGGGGHTMTTGDPVEVAAAAAFHQRHGTTTMLASLVTAPVETLAEASGRIAAWLDAAADTPVVGIHLEGPFLSHAKCGAQNPAHMVDPTPETVARLIEAAAGRLRMVTIAPERDGAVEAIRTLVGAGVIAALGHSDAGTGDARAGVEAGATVATHLGNAMRALHHRDPGVFGVCLDDRAVTCEVIVDLEHLDPAIVRLAHRAKSDDGLALVTDAIAAAGAGDGRRTLGDIEIEVTGGVARVVGSGSLAGSTLTMDRALANAVACGLPLLDACRAASTNPARVLGLGSERGRLEPGYRADAVVLDEALNVLAVYAGGALVAGSLEP